LELLKDRILDLLAKYRKEKTGIVGTAVVLAFVVLALLAPFISPYSPFLMSPERLAAPSIGHLMGTDDAGRDVFSQFLYGVRISLLIGVLSAAISGIIGTIVGAISGFYGGRIDYILMRITDSFMVIPRFFLALVIVAMFGTNFWNLVFVIGILSWPSSARLLRAQFLSIKELQFVEAARAMGASNFNIMWDEILPNAFSPVVVDVTLEIGFAILLESELSFLGLGDPNLWSWGYMIYSGQAYLLISPWLVFFPGLGISLVVIAFSLIGDSLNKILNPRFKLG